jgi:hypothetical protein
LSDIKVTATQAKHVYTRAAEWKRIPEPLGTRFAGQWRKKLFDRTIAEDVFEDSLAVLRLRHGGVKHSGT